MKEVARFELLNYNEIKRHYEYSFSYKCKKFIGIFHMPSKFVNDAVEFVSRNAEMFCPGENDD